MKDGMASGRLNWKVIQWKRTGLGGAGSRTSMENQMQVEIRIASACLGKLSDA